MAQGGEEGKETTEGKRPTVHNGKVLARLSLARLGPDGNCVPVAWGTRSFNVR